MSLDARQPLKQFTGQVRRGANPRGGIIVRRSSRAPARRQPHIAPACPRRAASKLYVMLTLQRRPLPRANDRRVLNGIFWVRLGVMAGETHDNRLAGKLLSRLRSGTMLLAD
jgi:hypothetical protein